MEFLQTIYFNLIGNLFYEANKILLQADDATNLLILLNQRILVLDLKLYQ